MKDTGRGRRRLRITVLDLLSKGPSKRLYARIMKPNLASIMPQVVAVWCEEMGHDVRLVCYTGAEDLSAELAHEADVIFINSFTRSALTAYAIGNLFRKQGTVTVLGGPHARCYPEDATQYFDYVLGFTDKALIEDVLKDCEVQGALGQYLSADRQPTELPGVIERWKFIEPIIAKAPTFKLVPMIGSTGCPYTCSFCIDSTVKYQPLSFDQITQDLRFLRTKLKNPKVGWHDPNFGVRFDDYLTTIEEAVPPGSVEFVAESSLSLLTEPNLKRLQKNGFIGMLPGIESWYSCGNKSKTGRSVGREKMIRVSEHVNMVLDHIPYLQANFVLGLDDDEGTTPFDLTKEFIERTPGAFPAFSLFSSFGRAAPLNLQLQSAGRVIPFPFHFLNNNSAMNVRPKNYEWVEFYRNLVDLTAFAFSKRMIARRFHANRTFIAKSLNVVRAVSSEGAGRLAHHRKILHMLETDSKTRRFFDGESTEMPDYYENKVKKDLGVLWEELPAGALVHDPNAWLMSPPARAAAAE